MQLSLHVLAGKAVNADEQGRASPVLVRIYELKRGDALMAADYFSLESDDKAHLGENVLARDEFILRPGETRDIQRKSHPEATAIGVFAGFRSLEKATWRQVHELPPAPDAAWYRALSPSSEVHLNIELDRQSVSITQADQDHGKQ